MLVIKFKSIMNVDELENLAERYNCTIISMSNIDTNYGSIMVGGTSADLERLKENITRNEEVVC